tara:strand:- start:885 stop:1094 length:210 start_codon:yes stop_codon:yes gene_type:complete
MEEYKMETIFAALLGGVGILWHQLIKQVSVNRSDQKEFSESLQRTVEVMSECNELMRDLREIINNERKQ